MYEPITQWQPRAPCVGSDFGWESVASPSPHSDSCNNEDLFFSVIRNPEAKGLQGLLIQRLCGGFRTLLPPFVVGTPLMVPRWLQPIWLPPPDRTKCSKNEAALSSSCFSLFLRASETFPGNPPVEPPLTSHWLQLGHMNTCQGEGGQS